MSAAEPQVGRKIVPAEGLTFAQWWRSHVHIVDPLTGAVVRPILTAKQREFIEAVDSKRFGRYFRHQAKKTSKSTDGAIWLAHHVFADPDYRGERLGAIASWDEAQADIVLRELKRQVELDAWMSKVARVYRDEVVYSERRIDPRTGGTFTLDHRVVKLPRDLKGSHGQPFTRIMHDEYWTETDYAFAESLIITPLCPSGAILYTSYFPPHTMMRRGVPFFDLLEQTKAGADDLFYQYIGGTGADSALLHCPWYTREWMDRQARILAASPSRFNRIILNIPGGVDDGLITFAELQAALRHYAEPASGDGGRYWAAVDLGVRFDWSCVLIGHVDQSAKLVVDVIRAWRPTLDRAVSLLDVADELVDLYQRFPWQELRLDQSQSRMIAEQLQRAGIPATVVDITAADQNRLVTGLKAAFARRLVTIPDDATDLIEQLESVRAIESRRGLLKLQEGDRSSGDARAHDDLAFCLALLVDMAGDALGRVGLPEQSGCYRAESIGEYVDCYLWSGSSGSYVPSGCPSCRACPAHQAVMAGWREQGRGLDLRTYRERYAGDNSLTKRMNERAAHDRLQAWADGMCI